MINKKNAPVTFSLHPRPIIWTTSAIAENLFNQEKTLQISLSNIENIATMENEDGDNTLFSRYIFPKNLKYYKQNVYEWTINVYT